MTAQPTYTAAPIREMDTAQKRTFIDLDLNSSHWLLTWRAVHLETLPREFSKLQSSYKAARTEVAGCPILSHRFKGTFMVCMMWGTSMRMLCLGVTHYYGMMWPGVTSYVTVPVWHDALLMWGWLCCMWCDRGAGRRGTALVTGSAGGEGEGCLPLVTGVTRHNTPPPHLQTWSTQSIIIIIL